MPVRAGLQPVSKAVRDGLHTGAAQCAFRNSTPLRARRSIFGVRTPGYPPRQPTQSFMSSTERKRTFGASDCGVARGAARAASVDVRKWRRFTASAYQLELISADDDFRSNLTALPEH